MDVSTIVKDYTRLQKQSLNNLFDTLTLFQDHSEISGKYWAYQMGVNSNAQAAVNQYRTVLKQGRDEAKKMVNESFTKLEVYFAGISSKQPDE